MNERFTLMIAPKSPSDAAMAGPQDMAPDLQRPRKQYQGSDGTRPLAGNTNR